MQSCFGYAMILGMVAAFFCPAAAPAPVRKTSVVRADSRTGRLVRTVVVQPVTVQARVVPSASPAASSPAVRDIATQIARKHEVEPMLVDSVIRVESNFDPNAVSPKGAQGVMQLIPSTARRFGVANSFDVSQNIEGGVRYLKYLLERYGGDQRLALAAYNAGEGAVARYGGVPPYPETRNYVDQVGKRLGEARAAQSRPAPTGNPIHPPAPRIVKTVDAEGREFYRGR